MKKMSEEKNAMLEEAKKNEQKVQGLIDSVKESLPIDRTEFNSVLHIMEYDSVTYEPIEEEERKVFSFGVSCIKPTKEAYRHYERGLIYYNALQIENKLNNRYKAIDADLLDGIITAYSANEEKNDISSLLSYFEEYEYSTNDFDLFEIETFEADPLLNVLRVALGFNGGLSKSVMNPLMKVLENTKDSVIDSSVYDKTIKEIKEALQDILDNFSLTEENEYCYPFRFRANTTLAVEVFRMYLKGRRLDASGKYVLKTASYKNIANEILKAITARLQRAGATIPSNNTY